MITKSFKILATKYVSQTKDSYIFNDTKRDVRSKFSIPKSQVLKFSELTIKNEYTGIDEAWLHIEVTEWIWIKTNLYNRLSGYRFNDAVIIDGETHFGIVWDNVILKRRNKKLCFFCYCKLDAENRTKDHLISKMIIKAYGGKKTLNNNTVPCCKECNGEKKSYHPEVYRNFVIDKLKTTGEPKYRIILFNLNQILV